MLSRFFLHLAAVLRLLVACCLCGLLWPALGHAQDHILEKAYWTDTTGTATFEQARAASYTPYTGVLSKGFTRDVQWVRLRIAGVPQGETDTLVLRIRPIYLDEIQLYDPLQPTAGHSPRTTGDLSPWKSSEFDSLHHNFVIPAQQTSREVWLRLSTTSTQLMHVEALSPRDLLRDEHGLWLAYSALLALILSFLVWVFLAWLRDRDPVNGIFVLRQTVLLVYTASYLGYHRILLSSVISPLAQDQFYSWMVVLTTGLSFVFEYRLLSEYRMPRWGHLLIRLLLGISAIAIGLLLLGYKPEALRLNMMLNATGLLSMLIVSMGIRTVAADPELPDTYRLPKAALVAYYLTIVLVLAFSILPSLGLLQGTMLSIYGVLLYGLISGLFMTTLLVIRSRRMERLRLEVANHLYLSREQLAIETRRRQDQSQLLNMLMHELKTPLSVIDLALHKRERDERTQGYVDRALENMKSILERCVQTDRLVERPFEVQRQRFDLAQQLQQWLAEHKGAKGRHQLQVSAPAMVESDLQCVQIIAGNLIDNALKYGDTRQPVQLTLQPQAHADGRAGWALRVCNAPGPAGWPQAEQVFAKYYRSPAAQRQSGTGLGLFLSHNLALQLGGQLSYRPDTHHICFELWLPA
jgi:signal transduction histidine kinase